MREQLDEFIRQFHICVKPNWVPAAQFYPEAKSRAKPPLETEVDLDRLTGHDGNYHVTFL